MKLYKTSCSDNYRTVYFELASNAADASKARTRLKKLGLLNVDTTEVEVDATRTGIIAFVNATCAHPSFRAAETADKLGG